MVEERGKVREESRRDGGGRGLWCVYCLLRKDGNDLDDVAEMSEESRAAAQGGVRLTLRAKVGGASSATSRERDAP